MTDRQASACDIEGVLAALDEIVADAVRTSSRVGYFAAMYRKVTARVKAGIAEGFFDDAERMERLDVQFANRYLTALDRHRSGLKPTRSWQAAFDAARGRSPILLQHLLVGINAHINLDLGIVAAEVAPGHELAGLRRDFDRINEILASMVEQVQREVGELSPWLGLLDVLGGRSDEEVVRFSVEVARTEAWRFATELAALARNDWGGPVGARDARVARLARVVLRPGPLTLGLWVIRARESRDVARNIQVLSRIEPADLATIDARVRQKRATNR